MKLYHNEAGGRVMNLEKTTRCPYLKWVSVKRGSTVLLNSPDKHHPKNLPSLSWVLPIGNTSVKGSPQNLYLVYVALHHFIQRLGY